jgi:predicted RNA binding protein YcfA (HicA-like mRNA interferase family)
MTYRDAARKLKALGCVEIPRRGGTSHRTWFNPQTRGVTSLPDWGGRDLKLGTVRAALRDLGIDWQSFQNA